MSQSKDVVSIAHLIHELVKYANEQVVSIKICYSEIYSSLTLTVQCAMFFYECDQSHLFTRSVVSSHYNLLTTLIIPVLIN